MRFKLMIFNMITRLTTTIQNVITCFKCDELLIILLYTHKVCYKMC